MVAAYAAMYIFKYFLIHFKKKADKIGLKYKETG